MMSAKIDETILWQAGDDGCESFYVYGICFAQDVIHVFSEGRIERHDRSPHHIVHKKSLDGGDTWSDTSIIVKSVAGDCYSNPTPIFDSKNKILLLYALNHENNASQIFCIESKDQAVTWSEPIEISNLFENDNYGRNFHLPGPGHGVETKSGRLLFPVWHRRELAIDVEKRCYGISLIFSDDGGKTFEKAGEIKPDASMLNESRIVSLSDGSVLLNARSGAFQVASRYLSESRDNGISWSEPKKIGLPDAFATDSAFIDLKDDNDTLIIVRPDDAKERKRLVAYFSNDKGLTWQFGRTIYNGSVGYSDAVVINDEFLGLIYGRETLTAQGGIEGNIKYTVFAKFDLKWIMEGDDEEN